MTAWKLVRPRVRFSMICSKKNEQGSGVEGITPTDASTTAIGSLDVDHDRIGSSIVP
jgi:hypothetical protein